MPAVRPELGRRHSCFQCSTKFYDMNREVPICPNCGADQRERPVVDPQKEALSKVKKKTAAAKAAAKKTAAPPKSRYKREEAEEEDEDWSEEEELDDDSLDAFGLDDDED